MRQSRLGLKNLVSGTFALILTFSPEEKELPEPLLWQFE